MSLSETLYPLQAALIVLVQPRKAGECPIITKKMLTGRSTKDPLFILRNSQHRTISVTVTLDFNQMQVLGMVNPHQHFILSEFVFLVILCAYFQHIFQHLYRNCFFTTLSSIFSLIFNILQHIVFFLVSQIQL